MGYDSQTCVSPWRFAILRTERGQGPGELCELWVFWRNRLSPPWNYPLCFSTVQNRAVGVNASVLLLVIFRIQVTGCGHPGVTDELRGAE